MDITVIVHYPGAEEQTATWSEEEQQINFARDPDRGARCTTTFAAMELKRYLERTISDIRISFAERSPRVGFFIDLRIQDPSSKKQGFTLKPCKGGVIIEGDGRTGLLYGSYELLRLQGWRWYAPGEIGEVQPEVIDQLNLPGKEFRHTPSMDMGRGFDLFSAAQESVELLLWMTRNRCNICGCCLWTGPLAEKLGMIQRTGGHIFDKVLVPDYALPSGGTLWEEHKDWFGLSSDGKRKEDKALHVQFCVSQPGLVEFLAEELIRRLSGQWKGVEEVYIWGFDTWGEICNCEKCRSLDNGTNQTVFFLSQLRKILNKAVVRSRLERNVRLIMCAYEGTITISAPTKAIPRNLIESGDTCVFYPINRCYEHDFADSSCSYNTNYSHYLAEWAICHPRLPIILGEYYNVSRFEDLPLLFTKRIVNDLPAYHKVGVRGMTYMHPPVTNWGVRALNNLLFAELAWDIHADVEQLLHEYFSKYYGPYEKTAREAFELIEKAWLRIANWRSWTEKSVLSWLLRWDGTKPEHPLAVDDHFGDPDRTIESGHLSVDWLSKAKSLIENTLADCRIISSQNSTYGDQVAVNTAQAQQFKRTNKFEKRLAEDRRMLLYGIDVMAIMTELVAYHDALFRDDISTASSTWNKIEGLADRMACYYIPICCNEGGTGFVLKDALARSQVGDVLNRCRKYRLGT